jgi:hypothetical protein
MFGDLAATDISPWDDFNFGPQYYGGLLCLTAVLIVANAIFLTAILSEGSRWTRCKLAMWQALTAIGGLGIGIGFPLGHYALLRLGELVYRSAH